MIPYKWIDHLLTLSPWIPPRFQLAVSNGYVIPYGWIKCPNDVNQIFLGRFRFLLPLMTMTIARSGEEYILLRGEYWRQMSPKKTRRRRQFLFFLVLVLVFTFGHLLLPKNGGKHYGQIHTHTLTHTHTQYETTFAFAFYYWVALIRFNTANGECVWECKCVY